jgi:hypothetical protein
MLRVRPKLRFIGRNHRPQHPWVRGTNRPPLLNRLDDERARIRACLRSYGLPEELLLYIASKHQVGDKTAMLADKHRKQR